MIQKGIAQVWSLVGFFTLLRNLLPPQLQVLLNQLLNHWWSYVRNRFDPYYYLDIPQHQGSSRSDHNEMYEDVGLYLPTLDAIEGARRLTVFRSKSSASSAEFCPASNEAVVDTFQGATVWWRHHIQYVGKDGEIEMRSFSLKASKPSKPFLLAYFEHIANTAAELKRSNGVRTLHTNSGLLGRRSGWSGVPFKHPSSFDSLALDPTIKNTIIRDLDRFRQGKQFHSRVGRPWKRGYLLYGPPGTGKSSMVAAIANYMKYSVYDLELTKVMDNSELRNLLIQTTNKSMIVIEDIDCSLDLPDRLSKPSPMFGNPRRDGVTLSGLLNFTDGLWSCCGEERIIVFTTNHKDKLDPALLRSGRMDMHILLSFCAFPAFKRLAFNYLQIEDHPLFSAVEESMSGGAQMTPAEISEILIEHLDDPLKALNTVISALNGKKPDAQLSLSSAISESLELHEAVEERSPISHIQAVEERIPTSAIHEEEGVRFRERGVGQDGPKVVELANGY